MQSGYLTFVIILAIALLLIDLYVFKGLKLLTQGVFNSNLRQVIHVVYWSATGVIVVGFVAAVIFREHFREPGFYKYFSYLVGFAITLLLPKLVFVVFHGIEDIIHGLVWCYYKLAPDTASLGDTGSPITRSKFISQVGISLAAIPLVAFAYGIFKGRYDFRVLKETLVFENLPKPFNGLRIVQLSDFHIGSFFHNYTEVQRGIDMVNDLKPDLILFTGDLVNNYADEIDGWEEVMLSLKARLGKYSVFGNHDYSDYARWDSQEAKNQNKQKLIDKNAEIGFKLLLNESVTVDIDGEKITLIGVENWGKGGFSKYGDLQKASEGTANCPFKILMSHDPSHWDEQVLGKTDIDLTLSGHTHGMQFGIEIPGIKWSPVKWRYPRWAGLYQEGKQYLYVNRGFGYIGFPGRVGMPPEITLIELKQKAQQ